MSKPEIIAQIRAAMRLDSQARNLESLGYFKRASEVRAQARQLRDAAYRCM